MAKKKPAKREMAKKPEPMGKSRLEVRFDTDVYEKLKGISDEAGISVNQLLHGLARWAVENLKHGELVANDYGRLKVRKVVGCLYVGHEGYEGGVDHDQVGREVEFAGSNGQRVLQLDFTERRVLRDDGE